MKKSAYWENFVKENNLKIFGKYSNRVLIKVKNFDQAQLLHKKLYKKKFIVRPWKIDSSSYIACTLGSLKIMKKFSKEFKKILNN